MRLPLISADNPLLKTVAKPVTDPATVKLLATEMLETMVAEGGVGLAAPQVGKSLRLFVTGAGGDPQSYLNPKIVWSSPEQIWWEEGCLSLPRLLGQVKRPKAVTLEYTTLDGAPATLTADELLGRVLQHELDHLDGILFPDRMEDVSSLRKITEEEWAKRFDAAKQESFEVE